MGKQENTIIGATIERGKIEEVAAGGYRVRNLDRPGLVSRVITGTDDTVYQVEDKVYFFMFSDGNGKILGRL